MTPLAITITCIICAAIGLLSGFAINESGRGRPQTRTVHDNPVTVVRTVTTP